MPLRPLRPGFWTAGSLLHGCAAEEAVPATTTWLRSIPRTRTPGVVIRTPSSGVPASWYTPGPTRTVSPGRAAATAAWIVGYRPGIPLKVPTSRARGAAAWGAPVKTRVDTNASPTAPANGTVRPENRTIVLLLELRPIALDGLTGSVDRRDPGHARARAHVDHHAGAQELVHLLAGARVPSGRLVRIVVGPVGGVV